MNRGAVFVTVAPLLALAGIIVIFARLPWTSLRIAGLAIAIIFTALLTIARVQLGNAFSVTPQARMLVTHGIYSKIRHPVYVFSALAIAGLVLYVDRPELLLLVILLIPMQVVRARAEERVLTQKFGEKYLAYKRSTWF